jgi:hypothetical protein
MKVLLLISLFLTTCSFTYAQDFPSHQIDLKWQKAVFPTSPVFFTEVLDISGGGEALGVGYVSLGNKPALLMITGGTATALTKTLRQRTNTNYLDTVVIRITGLRLNEIINAASEKRFLEIEADLAVPTADGYDIYGPVRLSETTGGIDVSAGHARAIVAALEAITKPLIIERFKGSPTATIPATDLNKPITRHPIVAATIDALPDGVYTSYMDFRAAQPDTSLVIPLASSEVFHKVDALTYRLATADRPKEVKARELREFWGIQKDGKAYMRVNRNFYQLQRLDNGTVTVAVPYDLFDASIGPGVMFGAFGFGLVGGLVGALVDEAVKNDRNQPPKVLHFNLATGTLTDPETLRSPTVEVSGIIVESYGLNPAKFPISITTNDGQSITLAPEDFASIPRNEEVCFTVPQGKKTCVLLETAVDNPQTYYRLTTNKKGKIRFTWMPDDVTRALYQRAERGELPINQVK